MKYLVSLCLFIMLGFSSVAQTQVDTFLNRLKEDKAVFFRTERFEVDNIKGNSMGGAASNIYKISTLEGVWLVYFDIIYSKFTHNEVEEMISFIKNLNKFDPMIKDKMRKESYKTYWRPDGFEISCEENESKQKWKMRNTSNDIIYDFTLKDIDKFVQYLERVLTEMKRVKNL